MQTQTKTYQKEFDWIALFRLIRVQNLVIIFLTQIFVKIFLIDGKQYFLGSIQDFKFYLLSAVTILIAAAGYIINDYYDIKIDVINKPKNVIIGQFIKRRVALAFNWSFNFLALGIAWFLGFKIFVFTFFCGFMLWLYSNQLKRIALVGNLVVSFLTASSILILAIYYPKNPYILYIFALFSFFISLIREIVKDMEDMKGDASFGCKTLPIVLGIYKTKRVIYVFFLIFLIILLSSYFSFEHHFVIYLYAFVLPPLFWFLYRLYWADTKKHFRSLSNLAKLIMLLGILSMIWV